MREAFDLNVGVSETNDPGIPMTLLAGPPGNQRRPTNNVTESKIEIRTAKQ